MNKKILIPVVALIIVLVVGILIWQYFMALEDSRLPVDEIERTMKVKVPVILLGGAPPLNFDYPEDKIKEDFETGRRVGCGDRIVYVEKEIEYTPDILTAIYQTIFTGDGIVEGTEYINPITPLVKGRRIEDETFRLQFDKVAVSNNIATVYLIGDYVSVGTCDPPQVEAVLRFAAKQFPWIEDVRIYINGREARGIFIHGGP